MAKGKKTADADERPGHRRRAADEPTGDSGGGYSAVDRELVAMAARAGAEGGSPGAAEAGAGAIDPPESDPWATRWTELDLRCPKCNIIHYVPVCIFLNARESPELVQRVINGQFNLKRCPLCRKIEPVDYAWVFFDPERKLAVQVRSEWEYHAGGGEEWYAARLEDFLERWAEHDVRIDVVFRQEDLIERFLQGVRA